MNEQRSKVNVIDRALSRALFPNRLRILTLIPGWKDNIVNVDSKYMDTIIFIGTRPDLRSLEDFGGLYANLILSQYVVQG